MTVRLVVLAVAVMVVLALVWFRNRRSARNRAIVPENPDRGVIGEVATAYEDVGRQFFKESSHRPLRPDVTSEVGSGLKDAG